MSVEQEPVIEWLELWGILSYFGREFERRSEAVLQEAGLSHVQLRLLYNLMLATRPLSLSELATRLGCGKSNVAQLMDRLEKEGLVRRDPYDDDRRKRRPVVTEEGKRRFFRALLTVRDAELPILGEFETEDLSGLARLLIKSLMRSSRSRDALRTWSRVVETTRQQTESRAAARSLRLF